MEDKEPKERRDYSNATMSFDASQLLTEIERMVAAEVQERLADPNTLSELSAILEAMVTDYLERNPVVNPRPDSMTVGKQSEQVKFYMDLRDMDEANTIRDNALEMREETLRLSDEAAAKRKGAGNGD